jgi:3-oxoacyl-[acyl-carrier protein] reductase
MQLDLEGKTALVGGGSDGIGFGIARMLAAEGVRVAIMARREPRLSDAAARLREETGAKVLAVQADCGQAGDIARAWAAAAEELGGIDILVNNDGGPPIDSLVSFDDAAWYKALDRHFMYVVRMSRLAVPHMQRRGGGSILNVVSKVVIEPKPKFGLSVATWAAVIGYSKTLSIEVAPDQINVNCVLSGRIDTPRLDLVHAGAEEKGDELRLKLAQDIPLGRVGTTDEFARYVALLVSPAGRFVTGTSLQIDGGATKGLR